MVNKKSKSRKVSKKKNFKGKKTNRVNSGSVNKKDFEAFKFGVQRLKDLETELSSLDTRGFTKEVQDIKSRLKSVSEIPTIEKKLKELRQKIHGKYKPKRKGKSPIKEIHEDIEDVKQDLKSFKRARKQGFEDLKQEIKSLKKKPRSGVAIDSGVEVLVDTNFNDFLISTKKALSERIRGREEEIDEVLKKDLEKREEKYKKKHENLVVDFERNKKKIEEDYKKKYNKRVESELHREVANNFRKMLQDRLAKEKVELGKTYKTELKTHADAVLIRRKQELEDALKSKEDKFNRYRDDERRKMRDKLVSEAHKKLVGELKSKEDLLRKQLRTEYELKLKKQIQDHEQELKQKKMDLELEMQKKIKQLLN